MEITIPVDQTVTGPLLQVYENKLRQLKDSAAKAMADARKIAGIISQIKYKEIKDKTNISNIEVDVAKDEEFSVEWTLTKKIQYVMLHSNEPMTSKDITTKIITLDKKLQKERDKVFKNISTLLSINNGSRFKRFKTEENKREFLYSLS